MEEKIYSMLNDVRPEFDFKDSKDFVQDGYLDSFDVVTLISELEDEFEIVVDGMEVVPENFESVAAICRLIERSDKRA